MDYITLAKRMRAVREIHRLSQTEVASQLGVTQTYITRLENGKGINADLMAKALSYYGQLISLDKLFDESISIGEAIQSELTTPSNDVVGRRTALLKDSVDRMFEKQKEQLASAMDEMKRQFDAKMELLTSNR